MQDIDTYWSDYYAQGKDFKLISSEELHKLLSYFDDRSSKTALDIGCGTGQLTRELYHLGFEATGVDTSSDAVKKAKQNTVRDLRYLQLNIENDDPSELATYGLITCKLVYAFIKDKPEFISKVNTLLESQGMFVVATPTKKMSPEKPKIAVDHEQTLAELTNKFKVEFYDQNNLRYYICKKA